MIRRLTILLLPLVFIAFTGCGGKDSDEAPPTALQGPEHPDDMASRMDLQNKMKAAKSSCTEAFGPPMMAAAPVLYTQPGVNPAMLFGPGGPASAALASTGPSQADCANNLNMALYNITKMQNGKYWVRTDVQKWFYGNLGAIGDRIASHIPPEALANPQFLSGMRASGMYMTQNYVVPQISDPKARFQINRELSQLPF